MMRHTGGLAWGATSTRSRWASAARARASLMGMTPTCCPSAPIETHLGNPDLLVDPHALLLDGRHLLVFMGTWQGEDSGASSCNVAIKVSKGNLSTPCRPATGATGCGRPPPGPR